MIPPREEVEAAAVKHELPLEPAVEEEKASTEERLKLIKEYLLNEEEQQELQESADELVQRAGKIVELLDVDWPNYVEPKNVKDSHERFQYMFPLYRMDIQIFDIKLNVLLQSEPVKAHAGGVTSLITIASIKKAFCTTQAWREQWENVEALLRTHTFKEFVKKEAARVSPDS